MTTETWSLPTLFDGLAADRDDYAKSVVDRLLKAAVHAGASDIHLSEKITAQGRSVAIRLRVHGELRSLPDIADGSQTRIMNRVKALARLVTYRHDLPQEGRFEYDQYQIRVGTLPTLHGERGVIRLQLPEADSMQIDALGLTAHATAALRTALAAHSGVVVISGPAGTGKSTTAYACIREVLAQSRDRSVVSLEDPVECSLDQVDQSQINSEAGYNWELGLQSVLRQDPEVLLIGEIRDETAAQVVFKAATTGQLVITTLHARSAADALCRLVEMNVPVHQVRSCLLFLNCQRLLPQNCDCSQDSTCKKCRGLGIVGRTLSAETLPVLNGTLAQHIQSSPDVAKIHEAALAAGMQSLSEQANQRVSSALDTRNT
jgi:general secretion pathway protein E